MKVTSHSCRSQRNSIPVSSSRFVGWAVGIVVLLGLAANGSDRDTTKAFEQIAEVSSRYFVELGTISVQYDGLGNPFVELYPGPDFASPTSQRVLLLLTKDCQRELRLTEAQMAQLDVLETATTKAVSRISQQFGGKGDDIGHLYAPIYQDAWKTACEILRPHQQQRLHQLLARSFIRQYGWYQTLSRPPFKEILEISSMQRSRIASEAKRLLSEIRSEALKAEEEAVSDMLAVLSADKRRTVKELLNPPLRIRRPAIDLLIRNLERFSGEPANKDAPKLGKERAPSRSGLGLKLAISRADQGRIILYLQPVARRSAHLFPSHTLPMASTFPVMMLMSEAVQEELELADFQKKKLVEQLVKAGDVWKSNYSALTRDFGHDAATETIQKLQETFYQTMIDELLPHQRKRLARIILLRQVRLNGLAQVLAQRNLPQVPALTAGEVESLRKVAERLAVELRQKRVEWEERVERRLLGQLDSRQRSAVKKLIGPPLSYDSSWLSLTLAQLRDGNKSLADLYDAWRKRGLR